MTCLLRCLLSLLYLSFTSSNFSLMYSFPEREREKAHSLTGSCHAMTSHSFQPRSIMGVPTGMPGMFRSTRDLPIWLQHHEQWLTTYTTVWAHVFFSFTFSLSPFSSLLFSEIDLIVFQISNSDFGTLYFYSSILPLNFQLKNDLKN